MRTLRRNPSAVARSGALRQSSPGVQGGSAVVAAVTHAVCDPPGHGARNVVPTIIVPLRSVTMLLLPSTICVATGPMPASTLLFGVRQLFRLAAVDGLPDRVSPTIIMEHSKIETPADNRAAFAEGDRGGRGGTRRCAVLLACYVSLPPRKLRREPPRSLIPAVPGGRIQVRGGCGHGAPGVEVHETNTVLDEGVQCRPQSRRGAGRRLIHVGENDRAIRRCPQLRFDCRLPCCGSEVGVDGEPGEPDPRGRGRWSRRRRRSVQCRPETTGFRRRGCAAAHGWTRSPRSPRPGLRCQRCRRQPVPRPTTGHVAIRGFPRSATDLR